MVIIETRPALPDDLNFIKATMLRGLYYGCSFYNKMDKEAFFDNYSRVVSSLLAASDIIVACDPQMPEVILGYAIINGGVLHYCYTKSAFRKQGIQKHILRNIPVFACTHVTDSVESERIKRGIKYNPFLI